MLTVPYETMPREDGGDMRGRERDGDGKMHHCTCPFNGIHHLQAKLVD